ncbi:MAG: glutamine amidotransferase family protein [Nitrospirae bacterium]|nr:glutamine amidotransferase family protein [Nitrospirota bacterium]
MSYYYQKDISGCSVVGMMNESGEKFSGEWVVKAIFPLRERSNGLGGGFAGYGIYPEFPDYYAFHMLFESDRAQQLTEEYFRESYDIEKDEAIPTRPVATVENKSKLWRYFMKVREKKTNEEDLVMETVMKVNAEIEGAFVVSSGKNMGIFKGVGFPREIGIFYRLEEYEGYIWTGHGRFPTNSVGWWGGAHPFGLLDWSIVHNGEVSSYGINKRYLENFGYRCVLFTDTEVMTYLFDLLVRRHGLSFELAAKAMSAPFWEEIDRNTDEVARAIRIVYGGALVNGPFSIIVGCSRGMVGLSDRVKLRPLIAGRKGDMLYLASEECGIREVCSSPDRIWSPKAGEVVIGRLKL